MSLKILRLFFLHVLFISSSIVNGQSFESIFKNFTTKEGLPSNEIRKIFQDSKGTIWIGTSSGIFVFSGKQGKIIDSDKGLINNNIRSIMEIEGRIFIGTDAGFSVYASGMIQKLKFGLDFRPEKTVGFLPAMNGDVFAFSGNQIYLISKNNGVKKISFKSIPSGTVVSSVLIKDDKTAFIGTKNLKGIYKFSYNTKSIEISKPLFTDSILSVKQMQMDEFGNIWVLSNGKLFRIVNEKVFPFLNQPKFEEFPCYNFYVDNATQTIYLSGFNKGILKINDKNKEIINKSTGLYSETASQLLIDNKGYLWIGTIADGLFVNFNEPFRKLSTNFGLPSNLVRNILMENETIQYLATLNGLVKINQQKVEKIWNEESGLTSNRIGFVLKDKANRIIAASYDGIVHTIDNDKVISQLKVSNSEIISMLLDNEDNLYVSTQSEGLFIIKEGVPNPIESYANTPIDVMYQDPYTGKIYFGSSDGLFVLTNKVVRPLVYNGNKRMPSSITHMNASNAFLYISTASDGMYRYTKNNMELTNINFKKGLPTNNISTFEFFNDTSLILFSFKGVFQVSGVRKAFSDSSAPIF